MMPGPWIVKKSVVVTSLFAACPPPVVDGGYVRAAIRVDEWGRMTPYLRTAGQCPDCHASLWFDAEAGEMVPHHCPMSAEDVEERTEK